MIELILTPKEASMILFLSNAMGWFWLLIRDHLTERRVLPYADTVRLILIAAVSTMSAHAFFHFVEGSTHIGFIWMLFLIHLLYPTRIFYRDKSKWVFREFCVASVYGLGFSLYWLYVNEYNVMPILLGYSVWIIFIFTSLTRPYSYRIVEFICAGGLRCSVDAYRKK